MKKKAFVVGANKRTLKYAARDAEKIAFAFSSHGYIIASQDVSGYKSSDFKYALREFFDDLTEEDQFVFYFVGHSFLGNNNFLYFAIESSNILDVKTCISAKEISFIIEECRARNKMVVLDSCHSASFSSAVSLGLRKVNYVLVYASEAWEKVPELEEVKGGLLSYLFEKALLGKDKSALNAYKDLTPGSLSDWLTNQINNYKRLNIPEIRVELNIKSFVIASFNKKNKINWKQVNGAQELRPISERITTALEKTTLSQKLEFKLLRNQLTQLQIDQQYAMEDYEALCQDKRSSLNNFKTNQYNRMIKDKLEELDRIILNIQDIEIKLNRIL